MIVSLVTRSSLSSFNVAILNTRLQQPRYNTTFEPESTTPNLDIVHFKIALFAPSNAGSVSAYMPCNSIFYQCTHIGLNHTCLYVKYCMLIQISTSVDFLNVLYPSNRDCSVTAFRTTEFQYTSMSRCALRFCVLCAD